MLTTDFPDISVYQRDNIAEIQPWLNAAARADDAASPQLQMVPPSDWLRELWKAAVDESREQSWLRLPDEILEVWSAGENLVSGDLAFLLRTATSDDLVAAVAAVRTLGLIAEAQPKLGPNILPVLQRGLRHKAPQLRVAACEGLWIANVRTYADDIRNAARAESIASVRDYMLHAADLLKPV